MMRELLPSLRHQTSITSWLYLRKLWVETPTSGTMRYQPLVRCSSMRKWRWILDSLHVHWWFATFKSKAPWWLILKPHGIWNWLTTIRSRGRLIPSLGEQHSRQSTSCRSPSSSILNYTYTAMGARLLRVNILSPITGNFGRVCIQILETLTSRISVQAAIEARLDVVEGQHSSP